MAVFGQKGCIRAKGVVVGQTWLYLDKSGYIRAEWLYSGKVVVFGKKVVVFRQSGCIWSKLLYSDKSVSTRAKMVKIGISG